MMGIARRLLWCAVSLTLSLTPVAGVAQNIEGRTLYSIDADTLDRFPLAMAISIEVMWCEGDQLTSSRVVTAAEIGSSIATFARITNPSSARPDNPDFLYRTVRLRPVKPDDGSLGKDAFNANSIQISDPALRRPAELLGSFTGVNLPVVIVDGFLPNYIRVTVCQDVDLNQVPPRIFVQIADPEQQDAARAAMTAVGKAFDNVVVSQSIETRSGSSPDVSQVRYYYGADQNLASRVRDIAAQSLAADVKLSFLPELASGVRAGTIELWVGNGYKPRTETTYFVCEGERKEQCPPGAEWIPCYMPIEIWASGKPQCHSFEKTRLNARGGNKCGYDISKVTCYSN